MYILCNIPFFIWKIGLFFYHWSWNKTITTFAFVQYENLFAFEDSYWTRATPSFNTNFLVQINFHIALKPCRNCILFVHHMISLWDVIWLRHVRRNIFSMHVRVRRAGDEGNYIFCLLFHYQQVMILLKVLLEIL